MVGITALFGYHSSSRTKKDGRIIIRKSEFNYFIIIIFMFVMIAFRAEEIGADTFVYLRKFTAIFESKSYAEFGSFSSIEPLFYYLNKILAIITHVWRPTIIIAEAVFVWVGYFKTIKKYSIHPFLSLLAFISFGLFLSSLCLLRQTMAMSICVYSMKYVFEKKPLKFFLLVLVATLFHYTAMFFAIVYLVSAKMKATERNAIILIGLSLVGYQSVEFLQSFTSTLVERWGTYENIETGAQGYISFLIFLLITILVFIEQRRIIKNSQYGAALINLNYIHMGLWMMRLVTRNAERLAYYFTIAPILLLPLLFQAIEQHFGKKFAFFFRTGVILSMMFLFIYKVKKDASYYPYQFMSF